MMHYSVPSSGPSFAKAEEVYFEVDLDNMFEMMSVIGKMKDAIPVAARPVYGGRI